ncbi:MAG: transposase [Bacteroidetes bacterium]|nr:transposase [Bacteroidota bacterium]
MRTLEQRLSGESYTAYVRALAAEAGVDAEDEAAVRRFDRRRKDKKLSNDEWHNPHDPDAKIGKTKQGTTKLMYKVEHTLDLETGAIVDADVLPGNQGDTADLSRRVENIQERMRAAIGEQTGEGEQITIESITADKGYYDTEQLRRLQASGIETVVPDRIENRNPGRLSEAQRAAVIAARRAVETKDGRVLMRRRAEYVERSFAHVLDSGGARKTTLRAQRNVRKRNLIQALSCNLSLLLRTLMGIGTVKQALAARLDALELALIHLLQTLTEASLRPVAIRSLPQTCFLQKAASPSCLRLAA